MAEHSNNDAESLAGVSGFLRRHQNALSPRVDDSLYKEYRKHRQEKERGIDMSTLLGGHRGINAANARQIHKALSEKTSFLSEHDLKILRDVCSQTQHGLVYACCADPGALRNAALKLCQPFIAPDETQAATF